VVVAAGAIGGVGYDLHHAFMQPPVTPKLAALPVHVRVATPRPVAAIAPLAHARAEWARPVVKHRISRPSQLPEAAVVAVNPVTPAKPAKPVTPAQSRRPDRQLRQAERKALLAERKALLAAKKAAKLAAKKRASFVRGRHLIP
jgi:hypothetical protein